jgi:predicted DNA-binding protein (MmcQ/YjbR family)
MLLERQGVSPAPYLARPHWVAIESKCSLSGRDQTTDQRAHALVFAKVPKKLQSDLVERTPRKNGTVKRKKPQ